MEGASFMGFYYLSLARQGKVRETSQPSTREFIGGKGMIISGTPCSRWKVQLDRNSLEKYGLTYSPEEEGLGNNKGLRDSNSLCQGPVCKE